MIDYQSEFFTSSRKWVPILLNFIFRWVVEAVNGLLKTWKFLKNVVSNTEIPKLKNYIRIICALCNAYRSPRVFDTSEDSERARKMKELLNTPNKLQERIDTFKSKRAQWKIVDDRSVPDFPALDLRYLQSLTLGVYQVLNFS